MGCDIHIALARIKQLQLTHASDSRAIQLAGFTEPVQFSQFEFVYYDDTLDGERTKNRKIYRDYDLFAFLSNTGRGELEPMLPNVESLNAATQEFIQWLDEEHAKLDRERSKAVGPWYGHEDHFSDGFITGDHSHVLYPIAVLVAFDYDQSVRLRRPSEYDDLQDYGKLVAEYSGKSYRELFSDAWFGFLKWATEERWDLVIFSFDN